MAQTFKVLLDGKSFHGGDFVWSLPQGDQPGSWHEVDGEPRLCRNGFHLTDSPPRWWKPGAKVYVVEAEGIVGSCDDSDNRKIVAKKVRLLREATETELNAVGVFSTGSHEYKGKDPIIVQGSASVTASDSASVTAYDSASVTAYGSAKVDAYGSAKVDAYGSAKVTAYDSAKVDAAGAVTVISWYGSTAIKVTERAIWIDRSENYNEKAPVVHDATTVLAPPMPAPEVKPKRKAKAKSKKRATKKTAAATGV